MTFLGQPINTALVTRFFCVEIAFINEFLKPISGPLIRLLEPVGKFLSVENRVWRLYKHSKEINIALFSIRASAHTSSFGSSVTSIYSVRLVGRGQQLSTTGHTTEICDAYSWRSRCLLQKEAPPGDQPRRRHTASLHHMTTNAPERGKTVDPARGQVTSDCQHCDYIEVHDGSDECLDAAMDHSRSTGHRVIAQQEGIHMDIPVVCVTPEVDDDGE